MACSRATLRAPHSPARVQQSSTRCSGEALPVNPGVRALFINIRSSG
jgi:hypothetical protein